MSAGVTYDVSTTDQAEGADDSGVPFYSSDYGNRAISAVEDICKDGNYDGTTGDYYSRTFDVISNTALFWIEEGVVGGVTDWVSCTARLDSQPSITQADLEVFGDGVIVAKMKNGGCARIRTKFCV